MPLYREWNSDAHSLAAIWKIEEPESFFIAQTALGVNIKNDKRRLEHLTGRFLLKYLKHDFPLLDIMPDVHDKPRLPNGQYYFSISHSYPYVAAVVSPYVECGLDIQTWHSRMQQLQHKFLSAEERSFFKDDSRLLTIAWCAKEAAYKWQGLRDVDFIKHLLIQNIIKTEQDYKISILLKLAENPQSISLSSFIEKDFAFSIVENK